MAESGTYVCPQCGLSVVDIQGPQEQKTVCLNCGHTIADSERPKPGPPTPPFSVAATATVAEPTHSTSFARSRRALWLGTMALLGLIAVGIAVWQSAGAPATKTSIDFAWLPPKAEAIVYIRPADLLKSSFADWLIEQRDVRKPLTNGMETLRSEAGFSIDDIESITIGVKHLENLTSNLEVIEAEKTPDLLPATQGLKRIAQQEIVLVARLLKSVDLTNNASFQSWTEAVAYQGGVTYYRNKIDANIVPAGFVYFPSPQTIVVCSREDVLLDLIDRHGQGNPRPELEIIDPSQHFVLASSVTLALQNLLPDDKRRAATQSDLFRQVQAASIGITLEDGLKFSLRQHCTDVNAAERLHAAMGTLLEQGLGEFRKIAPSLSPNTGAIADAFISSAETKRQERLVETRLHLPATSRNHLAAMPAEIATAFFTSGTGTSAPSQSKRTEEQDAGFQPGSDGTPLNGTTVVVEKLAGLPEGLLLRGRADWASDDVSKKGNGQPPPRLMTFDVEYGGPLKNKIAEIGNLQVHKIETDPPQFIKLTVDPEEITDPDPFHTFLDKRKGRRFFNHTDCVQIRLFLDQPDKEPSKFTRVEGQVTLRIATETKTILVRDLFKQVGQPATDPDLKAAGFEIVSEVKEGGKTTWYAYFNRTAKVDDFQVVSANGEQLASAPFISSWDQFGKPGYILLSETQPSAGAAGKVVLHTKFDERTVPFRFTDVPIGKCPDNPYPPSRPWTVSTVQVAPKTTTVAGRLRGHQEADATNSGRPMKPKLAIDVTGPTFRYVLGAADKRIETALTDTGETLALTPEHANEKFKYVGYDFETKHYPPDGATIVFKFESSATPFKSLKKVTGSCRILVAESERRIVIPQFLSHIGKPFTTPDMAAEGLEFLIELIDTEQKKVVLTLTKGDGYSIHNADVIPAVTSENASFVRSFEQHTKRGEIWLRDYTVKPDDSLEIVYYTGLNEITIPFAFNNLIAPTN